MATAPMGAGQMKELASAIVEAIPSDLPSGLAQKWIGKKGELGNRLRAILFEVTISNLPGINWQKVYSVLGMEAEYAEFFCTPACMEDQNLWVIRVIKGATLNKVVAALRKLGVDVYTYVDDLDKGVPTNDRDPNNGSYAISFKRTIEADEENKNLSANQLEKQGHKGITLLERLLLELGYFLATNQHLDVENITLCSGSRHSDGSVPCVYWYSDYRRVHVYWYNPGNADRYLRSRSVVF